MKRLFVIFFIMSAIWMFFSPQIFAQGYTNCDLCGYCVPDPKPGNWESCRQCLYPTPGVDPNYTLLIPANSNTPPTPFPGRQYTMFGCVKSDINPFNFIQEGQARSLSEKLLNIIFSVIGGVTLLYLIYGAFLLMTSQSIPERINQGKRVVYGAIIGLIFSLSSILIIRFLATGVLKIPGMQ